MSCPVHCIRVFIIQSLVEGLWFVSSAVSLLSDLLIHMLFLFFFLYYSSSSCRYKFHNLTTGEVTWEYPVQAISSPGKFVSSYMYIYTQHVCLDAITVQSCNLAHCVDFWMFFSYSV